MKENIFCHGFYHLEYMIVYTSHTWVVLEIDLLVLLDSVGFVSVIYHSR